MKDRKKLHFTAQSEKQWDESYRRMSWWDPERTADAKVMVVGAGALGNEVLKNLALLNIGHILIIDFDTIEYSNLSRSVLFREEDCDQLKSEVAGRAIKSINPNVKVLSMQGDIAIDIGLGVFRRMDVIIGCLDNRVARLFINRHSFKVGKTWIDGAIENLAGQMDVFRPGISCYECQLTDIELANITYRWGCADVAERNATQGRIPTTPISSSIIGAMQTQEALKVIYENDKQSMAGQRFKYEGMNNLLLQYKFMDFKEDCSSHSRLEPIIEAGDLSAHMSIAEILALLENRFFDSELYIIHPDEVVLEMVTEESQVLVPIMIHRGHLTNDLLRKYQRVPGERLVITKSTRKIDRNFPDLSMSLKKIGIPELDILVVNTSKEIYFVELTKDTGILEFN